MEIARRIRKPARGSLSVFLFSSFLFRFLPTTLPSRSGARALVLLPQQSFVRVCERTVACLCELRGKVHGEKKQK